MNQKILIVDDDSVNLLVAQKMLEKLGYKVELALGATLGVELFKNNSYRLVFMDLHMPEMNGFEAITEIRKENRSKDTLLTNQIPIILLTGDTSDSVKTQGIDIGANEVVTKPLSFNSLIRITKQWIK